MDEDDYVDPELAARSRKLQQRLIIRPYDQSAVEELCEIAYKERNHDHCISSVLRALELQLPVNADLYCKLGKSYFRRWKKKGDLADVKKAIGAYRHVLTSMKYQRSEIHYFELATMHLRCGHHQVREFRPTTSRFYLL